MKKFRVILCGPAEPSELFEAKLGQKFPGGNGGRPVNSLAKALVNSGIDVDVVSTSPHIVNYWVHSEGNLRCHLIPLRRSAKQVALDLFAVERNLLITILNSIEADIIHAHWTYEFAMASLKVDRPLLITAHDAPLKILSYFRDRYRTLRLFMAVLVRIKARNISFVSPYLLQQWKREMFWFRKSEVIPNISPFKPIKRSKGSKTSLNVLVISDSGKLKNVRTLLEAWLQIHEFFRSITLDLVGPGLDATDELALWANSKGIDKNIRWNGILDREEIAAKLESSDLLVHPSLEEAQPIVLLEAMAYGLPVVAGISSGGVPWTIGEGGILVDVRNADAIARAVIQILENDNLQKELGKINQTRISRVFSEEVIASKYINLYKKIISEEKN